MPKIFLKYSYDSPKMAEEVTVSVGHGPVTTEAAILEPFPQEIQEMNGEWQEDVQKKYWTQYMNCCKTKKT